MLIRTLLFKIVTAYDDKGFAAAEKDSKKAKQSAKELAKETQDADKALSKEAKSAQKVADAQAESSKKTDKATASTKALTKSTAEAGSAASKTTKRVGLLDRAMAKLTKGAAGLGPQISQAFATAVGGLISSGIQRLISSVGDAIAFVGEKTAELDFIAKRAQKTGFGVEDFQRLSHVATLSGTDVEKLTKGITNLEIQLDVVSRTGSGPASEALRDLGLTFEDLQGLDPTEQLKLISAALSEIPDPTDRSRQAFKLMGEEGRELIPLFNSGAEGIQAMVDASGKVFTREELAKAEAYQDALAGLNKTISDIKGSLALAAVPLFQRITELADAAIPVITEWAKSFGERLGPSITRLVEAVEPWLSRAGPGLLDSLGALLVPLEKAADAVAFFSDQISFLLEVGNDLLGWIESILGQIESRWPEAFGTASAVVDGLISPLDSARKIIAEIFDFIERSAGEIEGVSETISEIKNTLGLGGGGGTAGTAGSVAAFRAAQAASQAAAARQAARDRSREERRADRAAAREEARAEFVRGEAGALRRIAGRRSRGGGGRGGGAPAATAGPPGLLDQLGLTAPGAVMAARPAPAVMTIIIAPVIKLIETMTITVEGGASPEQDRALQDAATQARDAIVAKLTDVPAIVEEMFLTKATALRARAGGGATPRGVT